MANFPVKSFQGGKTDFPIGADSSKFEIGDNCVINEYADLESRPGLTFDFTTNDTRARVANSKRIGLMAQQFTGVSKAYTVLKQANTKLFYDNATTMSELVGPASASAFNITNMTDHVAFSYGEWNEHTIISHESPFQIPVKVYRDSGGTLRLRTCGLPPVAGAGFTATGGTGANYLYALVHKFSYSVGSTDYVDRARPYIKEFLNISSNPSSVNITVGSIPALANATGEHYDTTTIKIELYRTLNNGSVFYYVGEVTNGTTSYVDSTLDTTLQNAGVTLYTEGGELENDRPPKTKYVHSTSDFTYYGHGYEVSTTGSDNEFLAQRMWQSKRGDPDSVPATFFVDIEEPITAIASLKSIPIIFGANSVYRLDGNFDDLGRGGLLPRKISDKVGCVGHLSVVQTLEGLYFAGNDGFYYTDGYKIYSLSSEDFKASYALLVATELQRKRIYGAYDALNKRILWSVYNSDGDTFSEQNQIYCMYLPAKKFTTWSSGYRGTGIAFDDAAAAYTYTTYSRFTDASVAGISQGDIVQVYDATTNEAKIQANWSVANLDATGIDVSSGFQTSSLANGTYRLIVLNGNENNAGFGNFQPSSLLYSNNTLYQGDGRGFCFIYSHMATDDVVPIMNIANAVAVTDNGTIAIQVHYAGSLLDLGTTDYRKWVNSAIIKFRPRVDVTTVCAITPYSENDDNNTLSQMRDIFETSFYRWGSLVYGDPLLYRRRQTMIDAIRRFPKNALRCEYKQLHLKNAFVDIYSSDVYGKATEVDEGSQTPGADLGIGGMTIPVGIAVYPVGYWVYFASDNYTQGYYIFSASTSGGTSSTEIAFFDPFGVAINPSPGTTLAWLIRGYPTNNFFNLVEYSFQFELLGQSQSAFHGVTGGNST